MRIALSRQNKVEDFYPLIKFLRIKPLNDWNRFNLLIAKPLAKGTGSALAMKRLQVWRTIPTSRAFYNQSQVVLKLVMLRRTKAQLAPSLKLPDRSVHVLPCKFNSSEAQFYIELKTNVQTVLRKILATTENGGGRAYMNILVLLLRLRQGRSRSNYLFLLILIYVALLSACDHPCLVLKNYTEDIGDDTRDLEDDEGKPKCKVCLSWCVGKIENGWCSRTRPCKAW
jgi:SNF2 family DNA or RNA helicase